MYSLEERLAPLNFNATGLDILVPLVKGQPAHDLVEHLRRFVGPLTSFVQDQFDGFVSRCGQVAGMLNALGAVAAELLNPQPSEVATHF